MCGFGSRVSGHHRFNTSDSALDILDKMYAMGKIGKEAYEEKKRILNKPSEMDNDQGETMKEVENDK